MSTNNTNNYYGVNMPASDYASLLAEREKDKKTGNNLWEQITGAQGLQHQNQSGLLNQQYSSAVAEAYMTNLANQNAIKASNLGMGFKEHAAGAYQQNLASTIGEISQGRLAAQQNINNTYQTNMATISNEIMNNAKNYETLSKSFIEYADYLGTNDTFINSKYSDRFKEMFTHQLTDSEKIRLEELTEKQGSNKITEDEQAELNALIVRNGAMYTSSEITSKMFDLTEEGYKLNDFGVEMFDLLQNMENTGFGVDTYGSWAMKQKDLGSDFNNWLRSGGFSSEFQSFLDSQGIDVQRDLTNQQLFNMFTGRDINDDSYNAREYFVERELKNYDDNKESWQQNLNSEITRLNTWSSVKSFGSSNDYLKYLHEVQTAVTTNFDNLENSIKNILGPNSLATFYEKEEVKAILDKVNKVRTWNKKGTNNFNRGDTAKEWRDTDWTNLMIQLNQLFNDFSKELA